ncbi:hypothetical protein HK104_010212 [Borealophlyctis nickersoniae]|nr:hypothetical protein HK104_010212 [Borealophlyctis nickersoniae]
MKPDRDPTARNGTFGEVFNPILAAFKTPSSSQHKSRHFGSVVPNNRHSADRPLLRKNKSLNMKEAYQLGGRAADVENEGGVRVDEDSKGEGKTGKGFVPFLLAGGCHKEIGLGDRSEVKHGIPCQHGEYNPTRCADGHSTSTAANPSRYPRRVATSPDLKSLAIITSQHSSPHATSSAPSSPAVRHDPTSHLHLSDAHSIHSDGHSPSPHRPGRKLRKKSSLRSWTRRDSVPDSAVVIRTSVGSSNNDACFVPASPMHTPASPYPPSIVGSIATTSMTSVTLEDQLRCMAELQRSDSRGSSSVHAAPSTGVLVLEGLSEDDPEAVPGLGYHQTYSSKGGVGGMGADASGANPAGGLASAIKTYTTTTTRRTMVVEEEEEEQECSVPIFVDQDMAGSFPHASLLHPSLSSSPLRSHSLPRSIRSVRSTVVHEETTVVTTSISAYQQLPTPTPTPIPPAPIASALSSRSEESLSDTDTIRNIHRHSRTPMLRRVSSDIPRSNSTHTIPILSTSLVTIPNLNDAAQSKQVHNKHTGNGSNGNGKSPTATPTQVLRKLHKSLSSASLKLSARFSLASSSAAGDDDEAKVKRKKSRLHRRSEFFSFPGKFSHGSRRGSSSAGTGSASASTTSVGTMFAHGSELSLGSTNIVNTSATHITTATATAAMAMAAVMVTESSQSPSRTATVNPSASTTHLALAKQANQPLDRRTSMVVKKITQEMEDAILTAPNSSYAQVLACVASTSSATVSTTEDEYSYDEEDGRVHVESDDLESCSSVANSDLTFTPPRIRRTVSSSLRPPGQNTPGHALRQSHSLPEGAWEAYRARESEESEYRHLTKGVASDREDDGKQERKGGSVWARFGWGGGARDDGRENAREKEPEVGTGQGGGVGGRWAVVWRRFGGN